MIQAITVLGLSSFNSRPHKEVDRRTVIRKHGNALFQFTTSQGGRPLYRAMQINEEVFQFTTSQGGRRVWAERQFEDQDLSIHDLTRRSTSSLPPSIPRPISFNSRPHKEVDLAPR